jgi:hypothetical protein
MISYSSSVNRKGSAYPVFPHSLGIRLFHSRRDSSSNLGFQRGFDRTPTPTKLGLNSAAFPLRANNHPSPISMTVQPAPCLILSSCRSIRQSSKACEQARQWEPYNPIYMDPIPSVTGDVPNQRNWTDTRGEDVRWAMGHTRSYASKMKLLE